MPSQFRYEYHWAENRVTERRVRRPDNTKRWPFNMNQPTLIAVLEPQDNSFRLRRGIAATDPRVVDAVRMYEGLDANKNLVDFSGELPESLAEEAAAIVRERVNEYIGQYRSFANEEDITGFLKGRLNGTVVEKGRYRVAIKTWTYARNPKEKRLGVDIGIIIDILRGRQRVIKALWAQAKRSESVPASIMDLQDLEDQLETMQRHTEEAYALIYTSREALMYKADKAKSPMSVETVFYDSILCERGDRDPIVVALTGDSKVVIEVLVSA